MIIERAELQASRRNGKPGVWSVRVMDDQRATVAIVYGHSQEDAYWLANAAVEAWADRPE